MINKISHYSLLTCILFSFISCSQPVQKTDSSTSKVNSDKIIITIPDFNADSAYYFVEKQVSFGPRVPGTPSHHAAAIWLKSKLSEYADTVITQNFKARTYDRVTRNGINLIASFSPTETKRVLLMSHWDSRPFADHDPDKSKRQNAIDGANDGASGVGVLLEMARQFQQHSPGVGVDIVFFDLEDWGPPQDLNIYEEEYWGLGAQYWSKNPHKYNYKAVYGILLDMVGASNPTFRKEYYSKYYARYVVDLVWDKARILGFDNVFISEDGPAINDDHIPVNKYANIPTIDIIHLDPNSVNGSFFDQWHTISDNMHQIDKQSLKMVGEVLLNVVYNE